MPDFEELKAKGQEVLDQALEGAGGLAEKAAEAVDTAAHTTPADALAGIKEAVGNAAVAMKDAAEDLTGMDLDGDGVVGKAEEAAEEPAEETAGE